MESKTFAVMLAFWLVLILGPLLGGQSPRVLQPPPSLDSLSARWTWAKSQTNPLKEKTGFYIAYSIRCTMGEHSFIGCGPDESKVNKSLYEMVYGKKPPVSPSALGGKSPAALARLMLDQARKPKVPGKKVLKEVGLLFWFNGEPGGPLSCREITARNIEQPIKLNSGPLYWLGQAENRQSIRLLATLFQDWEKTAPAKIKEAILMAVGIHDPGFGAFEFLAKVLKGDYPGSLREKAAFWIGMQPRVEAVKILAAAAVNDKSLEVRKKAVFGLYLLPLKEADNALIHLAKNGKEQEVRKKAIFWLGQKAIKQTPEVLTDLVNRDKDVEIQKTAVFALSQLPNEEGVPLLIKIAKTHRSTAIRKKAIFWLSQSEDPRALDTIIEIMNR
jgi:hypothetical protein